MFRKLRNNLGSVFQNDRVNVLINMGFDESQAKIALEASGGNVDQAAELLLSSLSNDNPTRNVNDALQQEIGLTAPSFTSYQPDLDQDEMMGKAIQASIASEEDRLKRKNREVTRTNELTTKKKNDGNNKIAKSQLKNLSRRTPAAIAAENRLKHSIPIKSNVTQKKSINKMLTPLKNKSKEEQISRLAARLSPYPSAVDTLRIALTALKNDVSNPKYRTIDKNTAGYQKILQPLPAAHDLLLAVNFTKRPRGKHGILVIEKSQVDMALLWIAITALEKTSKTEEYKNAKEKLKFEKELRAMLSIDEINVSEKEIAERLNYLEKLAKEPSEKQDYKVGESSIHQNIALIHVHLLPEKIVKRRFDGDDQLRDIIFWMGTFDSKIPSKILSGEWCLVDKNTPKSNSIPCDERSLNMTLQRIGCWPSGRLELRQGKSNIQDMDMIELQESTRGLGVTASSNFNK